MKVNKKLNIYDFKDPILYLEQLFIKEKEIDPKLSVRKWAHLLGIEAPELLMNVLKRKRKLPLSIATVISKALHHDETAKTYFEVMVKMDHENSLKEKQILDIVLSEVRLLSGTVIEVEDQSIFSHWVHMAILSMSRLKGVKLSKEMIKTLLIDSVPEDQIDEAFERLMTQGLLSTDEKGSIKKTFDHTTSKNDAFKASPHPYFVQVSELSKRGAEEEASQREFQCFSLPVREEQIPEFKQMIRNFRSKMGSLASDEADQVYQVNLQFFPLTRKMEMKEKDLNSEVFISQEL